MTGYKSLCDARVWPYTEHNMCILDKDHEGDHEDDKGRKFNYASYIERDDK